MSSDLVSESIERLLGEICTPRRVREIEAGGSADELWHAVQESGFADALVPEARGGGGLGLAGAFPILLTCGRHAVPVPLAHTMVVRAVAAETGAHAPSGPATFAVQAVEDGEDLSCHRVPYGRVSEWVLLIRGGSSTLLPTSSAEVMPAGVRGSLEADLRWRRVDGILPLERRGSASPPPNLRAAGACLNAAQLVGAMERVLAMTVAHANTRSQFGRSIGKFQAIQHQLSVMAEQVFAARMAARIGCQSASHLPGSLQAAVAKARTSEAAVAVAAIAHAVHGAIGITEEFDLQLYTRRLQEWRLGYGSEGYWNERVGEAVLADGGTSIVELVRERLSPPFSVKRATHPWDAVDP
jgi:acyl-CoA dehydrogenase